MNQEEIQKMEQFVEWARAGYESVKDDPRLNRTGITYAHMLADYENDEMTQYGICRVGCAYLGYKKISIDQALESITEHPDYQPHFDKASNLSVVMGRWGKSINFPDIKLEQLNSIDFGEYRKHVNMFEEYRILKFDFSDEFNIRYFIMYLNDLENLPPLITLELAQKVIDSLK